MARKMSTEPTRPSEISVSPMRPLWRGRTASARSSSSRASLPRRTRYSPSSSVASPDRPRPTARAYGRLHERRELAGLAGLALEGRVLVEDVFEVAVVPEIEHERLDGARRRGGLGRLPLLGGGCRGADRADALAH